MVLRDFACFSFLWEVAKCAHVCVPEVVGTERRAVAERALLRVTVRERGHNCVGMNLIQLRGLVAGECR